MRHLLSATMHYATGDAVVSRRLLRLLRDVASTVPDEGVRSRIVARGWRVVEGCRTRLSADDVALLERQLGGVKEENHVAANASHARSWRERSWS